MAASRAVPLPRPNESVVRVSRTPEVHFYCEFCGSLVRPGDRICPHCGSFFGQVRCPACHFEGEAKLFHLGCPVCGFAQGKLQGSNSQSDAAAKKSPVKLGKASRYEIAYEIKDETQPKATAMPLWVLLLMGLAFAAVLIAAIYVAGMRN